MQDSNHAILVPNRLPKQRAQVRLLPQVRAAFPCATSEAAANQVSAGRAAAHSRCCFGRVVFTAHCMVCIARVVPRACCVCCVDVIAQLHAAGDGAWVDAFKRRPLM